MNCLKSSLGSLLNNYSMKRDKLAYRHQRRTVKLKVNVPYQLNFCNVTTMVCGRIPLFCNSARLLTAAAHCSAVTHLPAQQHKIIHISIGLHSLCCCNFINRDEKFFYIFYRYMSKCISIKEILHMCCHYYSDQHPWIRPWHHAVWSQGASHNTQYLLSTAAATGAGANARWAGWPWTRPECTTAGSPAPGPHKLCEYIQNCAWKLPAQQQFCPETPPPHTAPSSVRESRCAEPKPIRT